MEQNKEQENSPTEQSEGADQAVLGDSCAITLFHGTSDIHLESIKSNLFLKGTWLAGKNWHGLQLAERTVKRDGGKPIVIEIEIDKNNIDRVIGRDKPSYRIKSSNYKVIKIWEMTWRNFA